VGKEIPAVNSKHFIDVTHADGVFVLEAVRASDTYQDELALNNSLRIKRIMSSPLIGAYCRFHFPAGSYYFNGAAEGWDATMITSAGNQSITGDGINATRILQKSTTVRATLKVNHSNCTVQNLSILSTDFQQTFNHEWEETPHQTAILLETKTLQPPWHTDPQILNVNINATGNNIAVDGYYRPFKTGIRSLGPWLNIYVHSMFILHVHNAIYINQGDIIAGPAKFIDVNCYATAPGNEPRAWNVFFKSEGHFMEQVELIHCTYIGSQFIYMDGTQFSTEDENFTKTPTNPVYNMLIDHCYINSLWLPTPSKGAQWSGMYFNLPPKPGGIDPGYGSELYSRAIIFTNNFCAGKTPPNGALFYIEGNLKGLTIHGNDFASGGGNRCIYVRATMPLINSDVAVRDIMITDNVFNDFVNPITLGERLEEPLKIQSSSGAAANWIEGVKISGNKTFYLPILERYQALTLCCNHVRQVSLNDNHFPKTNNSVVVMQHCSEIAISSNLFTGLQDQGKNGICLFNCNNTTLTGNVIRGFKKGINLENSDTVALSGNTLNRCDSALIAAKQHGMTAVANMISDTTTSLDLTDIREVTVTGNTVTRSRNWDLKGGIESLLLQNNLGLDQEHRVIRPGSPPE
jgi:parallel beta-helix repeat protein